MGGAAPKPPQLHSEVKAELGGAGVVSVYGLTEAPFVVLSSVRDPDDALARSEGPRRGRRRAADRRRRGCASARPARRARSACAARRSAAATSTRRSTPRRSTPTASSAPAISARSTRAGFVRVTGRLKDIIIRNGENISAKEVEDLLYAHPKIADVAVIGLPDARTGERCCAVVVPASGRGARPRRDRAPLRSRRARAPEDPGAARARRRAAAQRERQGAEARAAQRVATPGA